MSLDLNKLANKLDEALSNETSETLSKFLNDKRMTNNKQQTAVKLYSEEQLKKMLDLARFTYNSEDKILLSQIPIELPSDEEIEAEFTLDSCDNDQGVLWGLLKGAKWMRNKLQGGNI